MAPGAITDSLVLLLDDLQDCGCRILLLLGLNGFTYLLTYTQRTKGLQRCDALYNSTICRKWQWHWQLDKITNMNIINSITINNIIRIAVNRNGQLLMFYQNTWSSYIKLKAVEIYQSVYVSTSSAVFSGLVVHLQDLLCGPPNTIYNFTFLNFTF